MDLIQRLTFSLLLTFVSATSYGQASAVITGPTEARVGKFLTLNSSSSVADSVAWIRPDNLSDNWAECKDVLFFSPQEPGVYRFILVAVAVEDGVARISTDTHSITVTGMIVSDVVTPPPVDPDDPPPVTDNALVKLSRDAARQLNDPTTANALAEVLATLPMGTLQQMSNAARANVEAVLLNRTGQSRSKDWLNVWRKSINSAVNTSTPETYKASLSAIAQGLREA